LLLDLGARDGGNDYRLWAGNLKPLSRVPLKTQVPGRGEP
jgi:hypothetical protein